MNTAVRPSEVPAPSDDALAFHADLPGYRPTPVRPLPALASELRIGAVAIKDESDRFGLPAFKVLGASWAVERALREQPGVHTLVAASAGNHGRAVAHVAATRGLRARIFLPARAAAARRDAIAAEGADVILVAGGYEDAVATATTEGAGEGVIAIADVGASGSARWVIDGYATLFAEVAVQSDFDLIVVPVGVGSLAAAAARFGAQAGVAVIGVEPVTAACLTAALSAGLPVEVPTPGTAMAGLDCAVVSEIAWPSLRDGIHGTVTVDDYEARAAMRELAGAGLAIGDCGAAPVAALRALSRERDCADLRDAIEFGPSTRVLLIATEGLTDPDSYREAVG